MTDFELGVELASGIYKEVIREYVAENTKLRKTLSEYECKMDILVDSLTGGLLSKSMDTPNDSIEDAVREHVEGNLATENAKLRETVKAAWGCVNSPIGCHECRMVSGGCTLLSAMRELGIMVQS